VELKKVIDLMEIAEATGNVKRYADLTNRRDELEAEKRDLSPDVTVRNNIDTSLWKFRQMLKNKERGRKPMLRLAAHLEKAVRPSGTAWV
jgi:hypothetical protein